MAKTLIIKAVRIAWLGLGLSVLLISVIPFEKAIGPSFILAIFLTILVEILEVLKSIAQPFKEMMEDDGKEEYHD